MRTSPMVMRSAVQIGLSARPFDDYRLIWHGKATYLRASTTPEM
jgi:hypothetical protein